MYNFIYVKNCYYEKSCKVMHFGHLMCRVDSLEKTLMEGLEAGREGYDRG